MFFYKSIKIYYYRVVNFILFFFQPSSGLDKAVGVSLMGVAGLVFTYYTLWVVILVSELLWEDNRPSLLTKISNP
jgi:hypothetical protein